MQNAAFALFYFLLLFCAAVFLQHSLSMMIIGFHAYIFKNHCHKIAAWHHLNIFLPCQMGHPMCYFTPLTSLSGQVITALNRYNISLWPELVPSRDGKMKRQTLECALGPPRQQCAYKHKWMFSCLESTDL